MKSHNRFALAAAITLLATGGSATASDARVEAFFLPSSTLDLTVPGLGAGSDDGTGFGVRMEGGENGLLLGFEYQSVNYDVIDDSIDEIRFGIGFVNGEAVKVNGRVEFVNINMFGADAGGLGIRLGLSATPAPAVTLYGSAGMLMLEDDTGDGIDGPEFTVGARFNANDKMHLLAELRKANLTEDMFSIETDISDVRFGLGMHF